MTRHVLVHKGAPRARGISMPSANGSHPIEDRLRAFSQGRLDDTEATAIEAHLADCPPCCEALERMQEIDTFLSPLKGAGLTGPDAPGPSSGGDDVPPERRPSRAPRDRGP